MQSLGLIREKVISEGKPTARGLTSRDVLPAHESVHYVLIPRASDLDDDVVDRSRKGGIANQCKAESVSLLIAAASFTERYDSMCPKRIEVPVIGSGDTAG
jgi:hypothetical protein